MIKDDRVQLNDRFVKVFKMLEDRGDIIKNDRSGRGIGDVAEKILGNRGYGHIIRAYLDDNKKRVIDYGQAKAFAKEFKLNEAWLLYGVGNPFGFDSSFETPVERAIGGVPGNILFTSVKAFAGETVSLDSFTKESSTFFSLPNVTGNNLVAFPIQGNSMEPVIYGSDIVVCRQLDTMDEIRDNNIYAVKNNGQVWVKYVQRMFNTRGRITHLRLISANYLEHQPWDEEVSNYTQLYKVIRRVSALN